jgi:hypothetical protein
MGGSGRQVIWTESWTLDTGITMKERDIRELYDADVE